MSEGSEHQKISSPEFSFNYATFFSFLGSRGDVQTVTGASFLMLYRPNAWHMRSAFVPLHAGQKRCRIAFISGSFSTQLF